MARELKKAEEKGISPAIIILPLGLGLGFLAVLGLAAAAQAGVTPTPSPGKATLYGKVTDANSGGPVAGALITLDSMTTYTDADGNYTLNDIAPGSYNISVWHTGHNTFSESITIPEGSHQLDIQLVPTVAPPFEMVIESVISGGVHLGNIPAFQVTCSISNPNKVVVSHTIYLKWGWGTEQPNFPHQRWWGFDMAANQYIYTLQVTLNPGQTVTVVSPREIPYGAQDWIVNTPLNMPTGGGKFFILTDELGNRSAPVSVS